MKKSLIIIASLSVLAVMASCQQFKVETQMSPEKFAALVKLNCDAQESYSLSAENPQAVIFNVTANVPWTITGATEWLSITPSSSGASSLISDITVTAQPNSSLEDRSTVLTIKSESYETATYTVTVTQSRKGKLFVLPIYKDFIAAGGDLSFSIETNQAWEVRSDALWLSFAKSSGEPDKDGKPLVVVAHAEPSDVLLRTAVVTVTSGEQTEQFEVSQKGHISVTPITEEFSGAGSTQTMTIKTDLPWSVSSDATWLSFDRQEGKGDGSAVEIKATAAANDGAVRKAVVTVVAGDSEQSFEVVQKGLEFNIVVPENPTIDRMGGEITVEVNTTLNWEVSADNAAFTVQKTDDTHFTVKAGINNVFAPRTCTLTVTAKGGVSDSIVLTQDTNFELENCEVLPDGSVKLDAAACSRVYLKDNMRCINLVLTMGEKNFCDKANFWVMGSVDSEFGNVALYNWLNLGTKTRIRTEGNMTATGGVSYYKSTDYSITKEQLAAMDVYEYGFKPNESDASQLDMWFRIDGTEIKSHTGPNPFAADESADFTYFFGLYEAVSDGTWYVVKSCDITVY